MGAGIDLPTGSLNSFSVNLSIWVFTTVTAAVSTSSFLRGVRAGVELSESSLGGGS